LIKVFIAALKSLVFSGLTLAVVGLLPLLAAKVGLLPVTCFVWGCYNPGIIIRFFIVFVEI